MDALLKWFANQSVWRKRGLYFLMLLIAVALSHDTAKGGIGLAPVVRNIFTCLLLIWALGEIAKKYKAS